MDEAGALGALRSLQRRYYLDQLRIWLIALVFVVHCALPFIVADSWHIVNVEKSFAVTASIGFCYQWAMQLFFLVCGASAGFSLRNRNAREFVKERFFRLGVPYLAGVALLAPFQLYFECVNKGKFNGSMLSYYLWFYSHIRVDWRLQINLDTGHLWFLRFLLGFSLISLPLFLFLRKETGQRLMTRLGGALKRRGALLLFVLPVAVVQMALRAKFPDHEGWSNYFCWFIFFIYGYILASDGQFEKTVAARAPAALALGLASFASMGLLYYLGFAEGWELNPAYSVGYLCYQVLCSFNTCCWVLFFLSLAIRFLDFGPRWLQPASVIVLPFYILHHAVIIMFAFFVVQLDAGILAKYLLIGLPSLILTFLLCQFVVRPIPLLRVLFGMSLKPRNSGTSPSPA